MTDIKTEPISGRVRRGLGWSTAGNLTLRVGNFLVSILMARLIAPEQFGVFAVALTIWSVLGTLAEFGLGADLVRARDVERRIPTVTTVGLVTSGVLGISMLLSAGPVADAFESPDSASVIRLMSLSLLIFGFSIVPTALLQREFRQRTLFAVNGAAMVTSAGTMTFLALQDLGPAALAWGQIANQLVIVVGAHVATRRLPRLGFDPAIARESASFCLPLALANLLSWLLISVDNLIVARVMTPVELGLYVLAFNVSSWPMNAIGQSIRAVALPAFSRLDTREAQSRSLVGVSGPVAAVSAWMGITLATLATPLVVLLYGDRWREAGAALTGLAVFGALRIMFDLLATFLIAIGASRSVLLVQIWWLLIMLPAMYVGVSRYGLAGAGWTHVVVGLGAVLPAYLLCLHLARVDWLGFLSGCVRPALMSVPATLACVLVVDHMATPQAALLAGCASVVLLYAVPVAPWVTRQLRLLRGHEPIAPVLTPD
jgi:PST family polysaccharide transporter